MCRISLVILFMTLSAWANADGTISGWVRVHGHQYPLHPVTIRVIDAETGVAIPGLSAENRPDGTYDIPGVPEGHYKVHYDAHGEVRDYLDELAGNVFCDNAGCDMVALGALIEVGSGTTTLNVNLHQGVTMSGRVTRGGSGALEGVTVEFFDENGEPHCCTRLTGANGEWERPAWYPATYYVAARYAEPSPYRPETWRDTPCSGCDVTAKGTPITFNYYTGYSGIDFRLERVDADPDIEVEAIPRQKYSGSWFNAERDGEGFIVEILDRPGPEGRGQEVVVFWFTYAPDGRQAWMVGAGAITGRIAEVEFEITSGAYFGTEFDAGDVNRRIWGSLRLEFLDCDHAYAQYAGDYGSGQLDLTRLSAIHGLRCGDADDAEASGNSRYSGAWFNPSRSGQGFIVEIFDEAQVLAYWFTYDTDGSQMWMLGLGDLDAALKSGITMQRATGGRFGDEFDPQAIQLEDWGEVSFQFGECDDASYSWSAPEPYASGAFVLTRLTALKNINC